MIIGAARKKKRRRQRLYGVIFLVFLLAAAGVVLCWFPFSLQDIGRITRLAAGRITEKSADIMSADSILRGSVFDRNFQELAVSYRVYSLYARPIELGNRSKVARLLARVIGENQDVIEARLKRSQGVIAVAGDLDQKQAAAIKGLKIAGVFCKPKEKRFYPEHEIAAQVIGFSDNGVGLAGVEGLYDTILRHGEFKGDTVPEIDFAGQNILGRARMDLVLTLDLGLQKEIEQRLWHYMKRQQASEGLALLLQPETGAVLAAVVLPSFDPNYFWQSTDASHRSFFCNFIDPRLLRPLLVRAAAVRRNGALGRDLLPETIAAPDFGLSDKDIEQYETAIGLYEPVQSLSPAGDGKVGPRGKTGPGPAAAGWVNIMQLATTVAGLVNGGWKIRPHVLDSVLDRSSGRRFHRSHEFDSQVARYRIMSPAMGVRMRAELFATAKRNPDGYLLYTDSTVGIANKGGGSRYVMQNIMIGMMPATFPTILLALFTRRDYLYPLARSTAKGTKRLASLGRQLLPSLYRQAAAWKMTTHVPAGVNKANYEQFLVSRSIDFQPRKAGAAAPDSLMPRLTGLSLRKGLRRLSRYNLRIRVEGSGRIVAQNPPPGRPLNNAGECVLTLAPEI